SDDGGRCADGRLKCAVTGVTGGDKHYYSARDETIHFDAKRTLPAGEPFRLEVITQAHVHAMNEQPASIAIDLLNMPDRSDKIADRPVAVLVQHAKTHQPGLRSHPAYPVKSDGLGFDVFGVVL